MSNIVTPEAILSYPALFEPKQKMNSTELEYSCTLVFPPGTDLSQLEEAAKSALADKFGGKLGELARKGQIRSPFRRDAEDKGYPPGSIFINVKSKAKPGLVARYKGPDGRPAPITDPAELYPGARVRASIRAFAYDANGNKGASFGLVNLQKLGDGDRLDGRRDARDEFEAYEDAPADFSGGGTGTSTSNSAALDLL